MKGPYGRDIGLRLHTTDDDTLSATIVDKDGMPVAVERFEMGMDEAVDLEHGLQKYAKTVSDSIASILVKARNDADEVQALDVSGANAVCIRNLCTAYEQMRSYLDLAKALGHTARARDTKPDERDVALDRLRSALNDLDQVLRVMEANLRLMAPDEMDGDEDGGTA